MINKYKVGVRSDGDYDYEVYSIRCDACGKSRDYDKCGREFFTFDGAKNYGKENGWKLRKKNDRWLNICPECAKEDNNA